MVQGGVRPGERLRSFGALLKFLNPGNRRSYSEYDLARGFVAGAPWVMMIGAALVFIGLIGIAISG